VASRRTNAKHHFDRFSIPVDRPQRQFTYSRDDVDIIIQHLTRNRRQTQLLCYRCSQSARIDALIPKQPESALLAVALSKNASVFALFGGQRTNEVYFDELASRQHSCSQSRFFLSSCSGLQVVLGDTIPLRICPHIILFASDNINFVAGSDFSSADDV
jgi:hypothetical protein